MSSILFSSDSSISRHVARFAPCGWCRLLKIMLLCLVLFSSADVHAHSLPGTVDPARNQERFSPPAATHLPEAPDFVPPSSEPTLLEPPPATEGFILRELKIEGAMAIPQTELQSLYEGRIGQKVDFTIIKYIADRITAVYRERGFFLSRALIPEQDIDNGIVRIAVIEGYVSDIKLQGSAYPHISNADNFGILKKLVANIKAMRPLHGETLERELLRLKDLNGIKTNVVMQALPSVEAQPGAIGMTITVEEVPTNYTVSLDNFGSRYAGPLEMSGSAIFNNIFSSFDAFSVVAVGAFPLSEAKIFGSAYAVPVSSVGTSINVQAGYSTLTPRYALNIFDVESESYTIKASLDQDIVRSRKKNLKAALIFDAINVSTDYLGEELYDDRLRSVRLATRFDYTDNLQGVNTADITLSQGLDVLGVRKTGSANLSRATGQSDYTKIEANLNRTQQIGSSFQVFGSASGQYAWSPLLSSEEFGYGGQVYGRAYDPSEMTGDHGIAASAELRYQGLPEISNAAFQPFMFYDIGKVWKPDGGAEDKAVSGASAGIGVRAFYDNRVSGYLVTAVPLTRAASAAPGYTHENGPRVLFKLSSNF